MRYSIFVLAVLFVLVAFLLSSCSQPTTSQETPTPIATPVPISTPTGSVHNLTQDKYYATIQAAIDDARNGDEIMVSRGTYNENIDFRGKDILLRSEDPGNPSIVATTIIDGGGRGSVVTFKQGETNRAALMGFTVRNGSGTLTSFGYSGGGIYIDNASPAIMSNMIKDNHAFDGGGIYIHGQSNAGILSNIIEENIAYGSGGGIAVEGSSSPTILGNTFRYNRAVFAGGGIFVGVWANVEDIMGNYWLRRNCPPAGAEANGVWTYQSNTFSGNLHQNGQPTAGCHVYFY